MTIYTKQGDQGITSLIGGKRIYKNHPRIKALGDVDELSAALGVLRVYCKKKRTDALLQSIQHDLYVIGAELAGPKRKMPKITTQNITMLEKTIDALAKKCPPPKNFVVPGGAPFSAYAHLCRTIARRAERTVAALSRTEKINPEIIVYLNRVSDLLFILSACAKASF